MNIVLRRKALGWNALELAEKAGVPYPTLRDIEAGISGGHADTKAAIAAALNCTLADLYLDPLASPRERIAHEMAKASLSERHSLSEAGDILSRLASLKPEHRDIVLSLLYMDATIAKGLPAPLAHILQSLVRALSKL